MPAARVEHASSGRFGIIGRRRDDISWTGALATSVAPHLLLRETPGLSYLVPKTSHCNAHLSAMGLGQLVELQLP